MKLFSPRIALIGIVIIAFSLRFYQLGQIPMSLNWDEVAFGYNAYSIGIDGRDEFGKLLPYKYLESYGDYKPPLYAYLTVLPVKIFGLNEFSVRFASAFFGTLTVLVTYFLTKRLFPKSKHNQQLALFASLVLAISPWHINLSRAAFEANVATFFIVVGVWCFLTAVQKNMWLLTLSAISFGLSFYTFNTSRIVSPLLVTVLVISHWKILLKYIKPTIAAGVVGAILVLPLASFLVSPQAELRYKEVNIFSDPTLVATANQEVVNDNNVFWSKIVHNRRVIFAREFLKHYFDNFNPNFLFISGDENHRFGTKDVGLLYIWEIPFVVLGFILLLKEKEGYWWLVLLWILVGVIPAATARETPHALRIETIIPTFQIISAVGITWFVQFFFRKRVTTRLQYGIVTIVFFLLFCNVLYYLHGYYAHYGTESAGEWQYGYKDAVNYTQSVAPHYDQINLTEQLGRPYAYLLFYTKENPKIFRQTAIVDRDVFGFVDVKQVGKYHFAKNVSTIQSNGRKVLYVDIPENLPAQHHIVKEFRYPDGYLRLVAYTKS